MNISTIKSAYRKHINNKNRNILRWVFLIGITIYLIASAAPHEGVIERSSMRNIIFWSLNGILLLVVAVNMILSIYAAIKKVDRKNLGNALCSIVIAILLLLFVMDIYNHNLFYSIQQSIIRLLA